MESEIRPAETRKRRYQNKAGQKNQDDAVRHGHCEEIGRRGKGHGAGEDRQ
jgi:hypothetical protein